VAEVPHGVLKIRHGEADMVKGCHSTIIDRARTLPRMPFQGFSDTRRP
jgi:hypothetical protein